MLVILWIPSWINEYPGKTYLPPRNLCKTSQKHRCFEAGEPPEGKRKISTYPWGVKTASYIASVLSSCSKDAKTWRCTKGTVKLCQFHLASNFIHWCCRCSFLMLLFIIFMVETKPNTSLTFLLLPNSTNRVVSTFSTIRVFYNATSIFFTESVLQWTNKPMFVSIVIWELLSDRHLGITVN